jgi:hypothetical protein
MYPQTLTFFVQYWQTTQKDEVFDPVVSQTGAVQQDDPFPFGFPHTFHNTFLQRFLLPFAISCIGHSSKRFR